jgi:hypothetical protein
MAYDNPQIREPKAPGPWVDCFDCVCGATYQEFRAGIRKAVACARFRVAASQKGHPYDGFRRRRSILWMMRVMKLARWYEEHFQCGYMMEEG